MVGSEYEKKACLIMPVTQADGAVELAVGMSFPVAGEGARGLQWAGDYTAISMWS